MTKAEYIVWDQYMRRSEAERPAASHISAALAAFPTLFQREIDRREDVVFVYRLAVTRGDWLSGSNTSAQPIQITVPPSTVATNIGDVSAAEQLVLTLERFPDVLGKIAIVYEHGNFSDKDQVGWGYNIRQAHQPSHTHLVTHDDLDFEKFIERDGPVPTMGVGAFFQRKHEELRKEDPECAARYPRSHGDSLRKRYQRLQKRKERMGLSS